MASRRKHGKTSRPADAGSATAAMERARLLRQAESARKKIRKQAVKDRAVEDVRNKFSLPDALIVRLLPVQKTMAALPRRRPRRPGGPADGLQAADRPPPDPQRLRRMQRDASVRAGKRLASELAHLEKALPMQMVLLKCAAVVLQHGALADASARAAREAEAATVLGMSLPADEREYVRLTHTVGARRRLAEDPDAAVKTALDRVRAHSDAARMARMAADAAAVAASCAKAAQEAAVAATDRERRRQAKLPVWQRGRPSLSARKRAEEKRQAELEAAAALGPLPEVAFLEAEGRFTFGDLCDVFPPILGHNDPHQLGAAVQNLEAQKFILRDHRPAKGNKKKGGGRGGKGGGGDGVGGEAYDDDAYLAALPMAAGIDARFVNGGRPGLRAWLAAFAPDAHAAPGFLRALDGAGVRTVRGLATFAGEADGDRLAAIVKATDPKPGTKGARRRLGRTLAAVAQLRVGVREDYEWERRRVRYRLSARTGAVLLRMVLRALSEANSDGPQQQKQKTQKKKGRAAGKNTGGAAEDERRHCSGCKYGTCAHAWDCGQSQLELLKCRWRAARAARAQRPLPPPVRDSAQREREQQEAQGGLGSSLSASSSPSMADELTWYDALRRRLHLFKGWGYGADPRTVVVPARTRRARRLTAEAAAALGAARAAADAVETARLQREAQLHAPGWGCCRDRRCRRRHPQYDVAATDGAMEARFLASPTVRGGLLSPLPSRFEVFVKPETATQAVGGPAGPSLLPASWGIGGGGGGGGGGDGDGSDGGGGTTAPFHGVRAGGGVRLVARQRSDPALPAPPRLLLRVETRCPDHSMVPPLRVFRSGPPPLAVPSLPLPARGQRVLRQPINFEFTPPTVIGTYQEAKSQSTTVGVIQG